MAGSTRLIPLGGLGEVGKNMMVVESDDGIIVIDAGLSFPRDEHLGVDLVLPDFSYLQDHESDIRAVVLTHGHEDHVGALPYLLREVRIPEIWATGLTLGLVKSKLDEHGLMKDAELIEAVPEDGPTQIGPYTAEFVRMAHSIPDAVAVVLETPGGRIVHTGDYKIDHTPVDGFRTDLGALADLGNRGVDLLLGDSTNAERPGVTQSERTVGEVFRQIIPQRSGRILIASFASNVHRVQQAIDVALEDGRKVCLIGRSLRKNVNIARNLGYIDVPEDLLVKPDVLPELRPDETMILCTGSQGEPMSALTRMAYNDHQHVQIEEGDTVIISAKPVPGNELRVHDTINRLAKSGAEVLHQEIAPVHVSGHGHAEELRTILAVLRPRNVMPVHGEFRMLAAHARLARDAGVDSDNIVLAENGSVVELANGRAEVVGVVESRRDLRRRARSGGCAGRGASRPAPPLRGRRPHRRRHRRIAERARDRRARGDLARLRRARGLPARRGAGRGPTHPRALPLRGHLRAQAPAGAHPRRGGPADPRAHRPPADDPARSS